jgi:hypothetical protein
MVLRRTFQRSFLPMARLLFVMAVAAQRAAASASPPSYAGTGVINNAEFYAATSLAAASTAAGGYQYAFVDYAGSGNYAGAPGGWTQVCTAKGAASIAVFAHLNGANEPASNTWGVGGTVGGVYAIAIGAVTNSAGIDGSICSAPGNGAGTITIGTPNIGSSGASDFTATWATVSGSAGSLIFSGPNNQSVWAPGANAAEGYYYTGVPVAVTYTNGSGTPHFSPLAAQIAFLPLGAAPTPTPTAAATPTPSTTATPTPTPTTTIITTPTPTLTATPSPSATPVSTPSAIQFDGRTQGNTNASATNVIVTTPASVRDGDYLLVTIDSWNSTLAAPSSWTALSNTANEVNNGAGDHIALVYRVWHTGDPTSYSLGSSNLNYPKAVLRAYNGVGGIDRFACSPATGTVTAAPSFTLSALPVTQSAGEEFVAEWASDYIPALINGPSDLGDGKADNTQWATFDGDKPIPATGTVPTTETANSASGSPNWIGCDATLISANSQISTQAMKANDFLNTLGVVSQFVEGQQNATATNAALQYLGVRNVRMAATHSTSLYAQMCSMHSSTGVLIDALPIIDDDPNDIADTRVEYEALAACGALLEAEGPNEPNNFSFNYLGNACSSAGSFLPCAQYMAAEYAMVKGDSKLANYPVADLTEPGAEPDNAGLQFLTIPAGQDTLMPAGTTFADIANLHNYVMATNQTTVLDNQAWGAETTLLNGLWDGLVGEYCRTTWGYGYIAVPFAQCTLPKVTTETGWPSTTISQDQQGKLITNVYLSAAKLGWQHTFVYLLFDEPSAGNAGWGFFSQSDGTANVQPKSLGAYTHNLTSILSDSTSNFTAGAASYLILNEPATVHDLLLQKSSGTYELVIWDDRPVGEATDNTTVSLGTTYPTINVYDITSGTTTVQTLSNASTVPINLTDHALIIEF